MGRFQEVREAMIFAFPPPAIMGLGVAGGFQLQIEDRGNVGLRELQQVIDEMVRDGNAQTGLTQLQSTFRAAVPMIYADVDRVKAKSIGRLARLGLHHPANRPGLGLRQRLQQVRQELPGPRPGRPAVPGRARGHPPARGPQPRKEAMVPLGTLVDGREAARADGHPPV